MKIIDLFNQLYCIYEKIILSLCIEILKQNDMKKLFNSFTTLIVLAYIIGIALATVIIYI